jgi:hypothetical protein
VTDDDVSCYSGYRCRYFRVTVPRDGTLEVGMTHAPGTIYFPPLSGPIDMWIRDPLGREFWMDGRDPKAEEYAHAPAIAGETYEVGVVSYEIPGVTFQLRFSLRE